MNSELDYRTAHSLQELKDVLSGNKTGAQNVKWPVLHWLTSAYIEPRGILNKFKDNHKGYLPAKPTAAYGFSNFRLKLSVPDLLTYIENAYKVCGISAGDTTLEPESAPEDEQVVKASTPKRTVRPPNTKVKPPKSTLKVRPKRREIRKPDVDVSEILDLIKSISEDTSTSDRLANMESELAKIAISTQKSSQDLTEVHTIVNAHTSRLDSLDLAHKRTHVVVGSLASVLFSGSDEVDTILASLNSPASILDKKLSEFKKRSKV